MTPPRKRRTRAHVIADLSMNHLERFIFQCGYTLLRTYGSDYGVDLYVWTYAADGQVENGCFGIQLKATDHIQRLADGTISFRVDTADMLFWRRELAPVILVVYDARRDLAFWLDVRAAARDWQPDAAAWRTRSVRLRIPASNRLTMHAMRRFRRWKNVGYEDDVSNPPVG